MLPPLGPGWTVTGRGTPAPQGSMTCKARHVTKPNLQPSNEPELKKWRALVEKAGRALPVSGLVGPLYVVATHTIARPKSIPLRQRAWPMVPASKGHGDVDKFGRALLDGLAGAGLFGNDAQVCGLTVWKCYPDTPGCPDRLDHPGVVIHIYPIGAAYEAPYLEVLDEAERTGH